MIKALYYFLSCHTHSTQKHDGSAPKEFRDMPEKPEALMCISFLGLETRFFFFFIFCLFNLVAQSVKNPLAVQETRGRSLGREDPLEKEMVTHSSTLAWRIPWTEKQISINQRRRWIFSRIP